MTEYPDYLVLVFQLISDGCQRMKHDTDPKSQSSGMKKPVNFLCATLPFGACLLLLKNDYARMISSLCSAKQSGWMPTQVFGILGTQFSEGDSGPFCDIWTHTVQIKHAAKGSHREQGALELREVIEVGANFCAWSAGAQANLFIRGSAWTQHTCWDVQLVQSWTSTSPSTLEEYFRRLDLVRSDIDMVEVGNGEVQIDVQSTRVLLQKQELMLMTRMATGLYR